MNHHLLLSIGYVVPIVFAAWVLYKKQVPTHTKLVLATLLPLVLRTSLDGTETQ